MLGFTFYMAIWWMGAMGLPIKHSIVAQLPALITVEWSMPCHPIICCVQYQRVLTHRNCQPFASTIRIFNHTE